MARHEFYEELPSTQDRAIVLARDGAPEGSRVVARRQTAGRGRGDRLWASPPGGLYVSVVLRPWQESRLLPLAIGAELAGTFTERYGVRLRLKWPNDLVAVDAGGDARKLAGILIDVVPGGPEVAAAVAGIGVNGSWPPDGVPREVRSSAVALTELSKAPVSLDRLEEEVVASAVVARRALAEPNGASAVLARCEGLLYGRGESITVDQVPAGVVHGLGPDGALALRGPDGTTAVLAGDVRVGVGR